MATIGALLRECHRLRKLAVDLRDKLATGPRMRKAYQNLIAKHEEQLKQGQEQLKKTKVGILEGESTIKGLRQLIAKHEKQLDSASAKKEYDALKTEILGEQAKILQQEDLILELMTKVEVMTAQLPQLEQAVAAARKELQEYEASSTDLQARYATELANATKQIAEVEAQLPAGDMRNYYQRQVKSQDANALSPVSRQICGVCNTTVTAQTVNDLRAGGFNFCTSCGRVLYLAEE